MLKSPSITGGRGVLMLVNSFYSRTERTVKHFVVAACIVMIFIVCQLWVTVMALYSSPGTIAARQYRDVSLNAWIMMPPLSKSLLVGLSSLKTSQCGRVRSAEDKLPPCRKNVSTKQSISAVSNIASSFKSGRWHLWDRIFRSPYFVAPAC